MNTPAHTVLSVQQFMTKNRMTLVPHPPYSSDLAPRDFFCLFPWVKKVLKGKCFADVEEVKQKMSLKSTSLKTILSNGKNISIGVLH